MASEQSSITFREAGRQQPAAGGATAPSDASSIAFEMKPTDGHSATAAGNTNTSNDIQFKSVDDQSHDIDFVENDGGDGQSRDIEFEAEHQPPTKVSPRAGAGGMRDSVEFHVEDAASSLVSPPAAPLEPQGRAAYSVSAPGIDSSPEGGGAALGVDAAAAAAAAPPLPTAAPASLVVTRHQRRLSGAEWGAVVGTSRDAVDRTLVSETAAALDLEEQFLRVADLTADGAGLLADINVVHDPDTLPAAEVIAKIDGCRYSETRMLHDMRTSRRDENEGSYGLAAAAAAPKSSATTAAPPPAALPKHSFTAMVGSGMLLLDYTATGAKSVKHLELFFEGEPAQLSAAALKEMVAEHMRVSAGELAVRYAGAAVSDDATGAEEGWINGSVIDILRTAATEATEAAKAKSQTQPKKKATTTTTKGAKKKATGEKKKKAEKAETAATGKKKKAAAGEKKKKKAAAASAGGAPAAAKTTKKKKATKKARKPSAARAGEKPKTAAAESPKKKPTTPTKAKRGGSGSRRASAAAAAPPPHYLASTQSRDIATFGLDRPISAVLTTPRVHTPRTPRPMTYSGASPSGGLFGGPAAPQHQLPPFLSDGEAVRGGSTRRSIDARRRSGSGTARSRRSASRPAASVGPTTARRESGAFNTMPPQQIARSVRPTTPRSTVRPVIAHSTGGGGGAGTRSPPGGVTPSVSRRSHSPNRSIPRHPQQQQQLPMRSLTEEGSDAGEWRPTAPQQQPMYNGSAGAEDVTYDIEGVADNYGEADEEPMPESAPNPFV